MVFEIGIVRMFLLFQHRPLYYRRPQFPVTSSRAHHLISSSLTLTMSKDNEKHDGLEALSSIARLSDSVVRVLGQNPGKFTLQGTNTYIIGKQNPYTLVDTGEGREAYIQVLEATLRETARPVNPTEPDISDIIISHWHHDHVGGLPTVLALLRRLWEQRNPSIPYRGPRLHKFPIPPNTPFTAHNSYYTLPSVIQALPLDLYTQAPNGEPIHSLADGQALEPSGMQVIHAPGHTVDSICLYIPSDRALYTADNVLGQGTAVFEDLSLYLKSLKKMLEYGKGNNVNGTSCIGDYDLLYPGHGPVVPDGKELIKTYIKHRLDREAQVLQILRTPPTPSQDSSTTATEQSTLQPPAESWSTWKIVTKLYASYPESLWLPAAKGIDLHLRKLEDEGVVRRLGGEGKDTRWECV